MELIGSTWASPDKKGTKRRFGKYLCSFCGGIVVKRNDHGGKSCGCNKNAHKKTHSQSGTKLYSVWANMKDRCLNSNHKRFKDWGGRGIKVCDSWLEYEQFMKWSLMNGYKEGLQIDRKNNNKDYTPDNCRFITLANNNRNKNNNKLSMGKAQLIREMYKTGDYSKRALSKKFDVPQGTIWKVIKKLAWI